MPHYIRQLKTFNFWSNSMGWVDLDDATIYEQPEGYAPTDSEWFEISEDLQPLVRFLSVMYFDGHENQEQAVCHLLVELRQLCDRIGLDYYAVEKLSYSFYLEAKQPPKET